MRILIADNNDKSRVALAHRLSSSGYEVLTASDGRQAMHIVLKDAPDILVASWSLPQMYGLELCRFIRGRESIGYTYVILLGTDKEKVVEGLQAGANDYLAKPVNEDELLARICSGQRIVELHRNMDKQNVALHLRSTQLALTNERLRIIATTDELTELVNRREGFERIREHWASAVRHSVPLACILVDIDNFKMLNDTHGHAVGDAALRHTADTLRKFSRADELVCRWGGEEFLILCPQATAQTALGGASRLVREVADRPLDDMHITISAGVAERGRAMKSPEEMIKIADDAMYAAKNAGKNRAVLANRGHGTVVRVYVGRFGLKAALLGLNRGRFQN